MTARHGPQHGPGRRPRELERILSKAGAGSRKQARTWIEAGRVTVNGVRVVDPDAWFDPERDRVALDGRLLALEKKLYFALHKPRGYLTTRSDPDGRATVYELIADVGAWVVPVGRLDADTSGLLLFTNDTQFAEHVTNPRSHVDKIYRVEATPRLSVESLASLEAGVELSDGMTLPAVVMHVVHRGSSTSFDLTIREGRNRQVRRMVRAVGSKVTKLARLAIGSVKLGELASGAHRPLTAREVSALHAPRRSEEGGTPRR
jgi:pseudouridine synthase